MTERHLKEDLSVAGQISPSDVPGIAERGFSVLVTARPDGEKPGQPSHDEIAAAAEKAGLSHFYIPVTPGQLPSAEDARRFADAAAGKKVYAYCGMGPRAILLSSCADAVSGTPVEAIVENAAKAGIDLTPARPYLDQLAAG